MKKNLGIIILVIVSIVVGCTNNVNTVDSNIEPTAKVQEVAATPQSGKSISVSMRQPKTLNPLVNEDTTVDKVLKLLFESLFSLDEYQNPTPNIAESVELSQDGMTAIIKIKPNIKWHDGQPLTANDVVFSLNTIRNASDLSIYKKTIRNISTYGLVDKNDSSALKISFTQPFLGSLYLLNFPIIPEHYYKTPTEEVNMNPVGSGAYKFESFTNTKEMNLVKNDDFYKGKPLIDKMVVIITPDFETDMYSFDQGILEAVSSDVLDLANYNATNDTGISEFVTSYYDFIGFNFNNTSLNDKNIRKAIAHSMSKSEIVKSIYLGHAIEAETPISPQSWVNEPETVEYVFDLEKSKELIALSEFVKDANGDLSKNVDGVDLKLNFNVLVNEENMERVKIANLLKTNLETIGMKIEVTSVPFLEYKEKISKKEFDLCISGYNLSIIPDLTFLFHSSNIATGSNIFAYNNEDMNTKLTKAFTSTSESNIKDSLSDLQMFISEELPCVSVVFRKSALLTNKKIYGEISPVINNMYENVNKWFVYEKEDTTN